MEWLGIAIAHYCFRRGYLKQGNSIEDLAYHSNLFSFGPIFSFILCVIVIVIAEQNVNAFIKLDWSNILIAYMSVPLFIVLYFYYSIIKFVITRIWSRLIK